ncbi:cellulose biosynthesis protein [Pseudomonas frederiksbergensis]|uniref:Cellulose biosynthesis protein n=1 Tax=Pseudomonas frederiksbergensis TaxID=104087 RepID=A0A1J0EFH8_9PSED|nr:GNAT family N-acetyltransferase [Pseudomonas frederiksbergensis]APC14801.1 cellulose biosynthesis protein [Pseudomonas frederiksbergensis]
MAVRFEWRTSLCATDFPATAFEALRQRVTEHTPFNALAWLSAAERALPRDATLHVLLGWQGEQLCVCLPLIAMRERFGGLPFRVLHHLGYPLADRITLLACLDAQSIRQALKETRRHLPHALLQLNELPKHPDQESTLTQWMQLSSTGEHRVSCRVPVHLISDSDRQEICGDPRYKLRRARKRIAACGAVVRRLTPDAVTMRPLLQAISEVEAHSWKGDEGVGIFSDARHRQWINEAFTALAAQGRVRVVVLELDGRCISYRLGLLEQGRLYDYNLAFLPQYADMGSGRVLLEEWIRWGLDEGWKWIDASRVSLDNSSHQLHERMTGQLEHWRWSFYSWRPSGLLLGLGLRLWHHVKPRLHQWRAKHAATAATRTLVVTSADKKISPTAHPMEGENASPSHHQR